MSCDLTPGARDMPAASMRLSAVFQRIAVPGRRTVFGSLCRTRKPHRSRRLNRQADQRAPKAHFVAGFYAHTARIRGRHDDGCAAPDDGGAVAASLVEHAILAR